MRTILFLLALLAGCSTLPAGCPEVIIGYGNYVYSGAQLIGGSNGSASLNSASFDDLYDGQVSTLTSFTYNTSGTQTSASFWGIEQFVDFPGGVTHDVPVGVVGILNTNLPAGLTVQIYSNVPGFGTLLATGTMQYDQTGVTTSAWFVFDVVDTSTTAISVNFFNDVNGSRGMFNGDEFTIGEIYIGNRSDWQIKRDPKLTWAQTTKLRLSSADAQWPLMDVPVRQMTVNFSPLAQKQALADFGGRNAVPPVVSASTLVSIIMQNYVVAFIPYTNLDPSFYGASFANMNLLSSYRIRAQTAYLGAFLNPPSITQNGDMYYDATMTFQESAA